MKRPCCKSSKIPDVYHLSTTSRGKEDNKYHKRQDVHIKHSKLRKRSFSMPLIQTVGTHFFSLEIHCHHLEGLVFHLKNYFLKFLRVGGTGSFISQRHLSISASKQLANSIGFAFSQSAQETTLKEKTS